MIFFLKKRCWLASRIACCNWFRTRNSNGSRSYLAPSSTETRRNLDWCKLTLCVVRTNDIFFLLNVELERIRRRIGRWCWRSCFLARWFGALCARIVQIIIQRWKSSRMVFDWLIDLLYCYLKRKVFNFDLTKKNKKTKQKNYRKGGILHTRADAPVLDSMPNAAMAAPDIPGR